MSRLAALLVIAACLVIATEHAAWAGQVDIAPVRVHLSDKRRTQELKLRNSGTDKARFQVTFHAWQQTPDGKMELTDTQDLVVYPTLLEVDPGKTRVIKVSCLAPVGQVEKTYRVFVEELPIGDLQTGLRVLTRFGLPVFFQGGPRNPNPTVAARIENGKLVVVLGNSGNTHFMTKSVQAVGLGANGRTLVESSLPAWYVLAQGERRYEVKLDPKLCATLASATIKVVTEDTSVDSQILLDASSCSP
jgi:fimbrial chaperone protein